MFVWNEVVVIIVRCFVEVDVGYDWELSVLDIGFGKRGNLV